MRIQAILLAAALAGCLGAEAPPAAEDVPTGATAFAAEAATWANFTGTMSGNPVAPGAQEFEVQVPQGAIELAATLTWSGALADLRLALVDPSGEVVTTGFPESAGRRSAATTDPPASGAWKVRVTSNRALDVPFEVAARVLLVVPLNNVLADKFTVGGAELFKEMNVIMEEGASFNWSFTATGPVHYDIHSHANGETTYHERGTAASGGGTFVAPKRHIYSLLFAPPDTSEGVVPTPVDVTYRMEGAFRVHSHSQ